MTTDPKAIDGKIADEIRSIYLKNPADAESAIEACLAGHFSEMPESEKAEIFQSIQNNFRPSSQTPSPKETEALVLKDLFQLMLGKQLSADETPSQEMLARLSEAMNTLFMTLNRIVKTIDTTLLGDAAAQQTIRQVIGSQMTGEEDAPSLEQHLGRIEKAFLVSHESFKQAARTLVGKILQEIHPDQIGAKADNRIKFGPLLKAEHFDTYKARFDTIEKWFQSGRFMNDLLREFENNCQTSVL